MQKLQEPLQSRKEKQQSLQHASTAPRPISTQPRGATPVPPARPRASVDAGDADAAGRLAVARRVALVDADDVGPRQPVIARRTLVVRPPDVAVGVVFRRVLQRRGPAAAPADAPVFRQRCVSVVRRPDGLHGEFLPACFLRRRGELRVCHVLSCQLPVQPAIFLIVVFGVRLRDVPEMVVFLLKNSETECGCRRRRWRCWQLLLDLCCSSSSRRQVPIRTARRQRTCRPRGDLGPKCTILIEDLESRRALALHALARRCLRGSGFDASLVGRFWR